MKTRQFTEAQIVAILRKADKGEETTDQLCRRHAISDGTLLRWGRELGGWTSPRCAACGSWGNARLKLLLAERDLRIDPVCALLSENS